MKDVSEQKKKSAPEAKGATAVRKFHTHSIPLDMEDIARDWEKPVVDAGIAAKASVIVRVGMLDLGAGTGSFRVREMMHRIAYPLGVHVRADVNLTDIEATCTDGRNRITEVVDLPSTGVNTERIWLLEHFADWFSVNLGKGSMYHVDSQLSDGVVKHLDERDASQYSADLAKRLRERAKVEAEAANGSVDEALDLASKTKVLVTSVAKSLDDDNEEAHRLLADSAEVTPVEDKAAEEKAYDDAEVFTGDSNESVESANAANAEAGAEGAAALACTGTLRLIGIFDPVALSHDTAYIGAMLFVIPGFPLITGGLDMAKIDFPSGIQRVAYVLCIILMATLAGWAVAVMVHLHPEGFEPLGLDPWVNGLLRFVAAFVGVWGFSVLFNSPQRMCLAAALIGAITDTLRLESQDFNVAPEMATFIGAFLAGILASAWRSSVRRGWLPPHLGYPRICLTVPSIVIMVPGLYMYRAMWYLGSFQTMNALDWAFRAFMVIICLPIGLAMARVVTDKSWRYDI